MASERTVIARIRPRVVDRDGYCRIAKNLLASAMGACSGPSQWAHIGKSKRARTRKMPAEVRHTTDGTAMLCYGHHRDYDDGRLHIEELTPLRADGPLAFERNGHRFEELP